MKAGLTCLRIFIFISMAIGLVGVSACSDSPEQGSGGCGAVGLSSFIDVGGLVDADGGGTSLDSSETSSPTDAGSLGDIVDESGTVSLPVTIAKIDPASVNFSLNESATSIVNGEGISEETVIGVVTGTLSDGAQEAIIEVSVAGEVIDMIAAEGGSFSYDVIYGLFEQEISFTVIGEGATSDETSATGDPVTIKLTFDSDSNELLLIVTETTDESATPTLIDTILVASLDSTASSTSETSAATETTTTSNHVPEIEDITESILKDFMGRVCPNPVGEKQLTLSGTDADGDALTYEIVSLPTSGTAFIAGDVLTYAPDASFNDSDSLTYKANDGHDDSAIHTITFTDEKISTQPLESTSFNFVDTVITGVAGTYTELMGPQAATVAYIPDTGAYVMYFEVNYAAADATCTRKYWGIGRAVSTDSGQTWTQDESMVLTPSGAFSCGFSQPGVVFDGSTYHLFFATVSSGIAYATSTDGVTFSTPTIVVANSRAGFSSPVINNGVLSLYYYRSAVVSSTTSYYLERAWSNDNGTTWNASDTTTAMISTRDAWSSSTLFANTDRIITHSAFCDADDASAPNKIYAIGVNTSGSTTDDSNPYYVGGLLESADNTTWEISDILPVTPNPDWYWHHEILQYGSNYVMWSKSQDVNGKSVVDFYTTLSTWPQP